MADLVSTTVAQTWHLYRVHEKGTSVGRQSEEDDRDDTDGASDGASEGDCVCVGRQDDVPSTLFKSGACNLALLGSELPLTSPSTIPATRVGL